MQTGENSIIKACILYHSNSYTYIVLLFAVKYKFMTVIKARILYHSNSYTYIVLLFAVKYKFMTL